MRDIRTNGQNSGRRDDQILVGHQPHSNPGSAGPETRRFATFNRSLRTSAIRPSRAEPLSIGTRMWYLDTAQVPVKCRNISGRFRDGQRLEVARQRRHNGGCDVGRRHLRAGRRRAPAVGAFSVVLFAADRPRWAGVSAKRAILRPDARCGHEVARCARYRDLKDLHVRAQIVSG